MDDPWSSVEAMLRWQIVQANRRASDLFDGLVGAGELYPLPSNKKKDALPHGLPQQWAFGKLTQHQVGLSDAMKSLSQSKLEISKAESAVNHGDFPTAIYLLIQVSQTINSAGAIWRSGASVAMWRYVSTIRQSQRTKARQYRATIDLDGDKFSCVGIARKLAIEKDAHGDFIPAKELWSHLVAVLDEAGAKPVEATDEKGGLIVKYIARHGDAKRDTISKKYRFTSFAVDVTNARKN